MTLLSTTISQKINGAVLFSRSTVKFAIKDSNHCSGVCQLLVLGHFCPLLSCMSTLCKYLNGCITLNIYKTHHQNFLELPELAFSGSVNDNSTKFKSWQLLLTFDASSKNSALGIVCGMNLWAWVCLLSRLPLTTSCISHFTFTTGINYFQCPITFPVFFLKSLLVILVHWIRNPFLHIHISVLI